MFRLAMLAAGAAATRIQSSAATEAEIKAMVMTKS